MANTKLDRIERDIEKTRAKVLEYQKRLKDLEAQKIEEENQIPRLRVGNAGGISCGYLRWRGRGRNPRHAALWRPDTIRKT